MRCLSFLFMILLLLGHTSIQAQKDTFEAKIEKPNNVIVNEEIQNIENELQEIKIQTAVQGRSIDTLTLIFGIFAGLISLVLIVGTITSFISWNTDRKRSTETYYLAVEKEKETTSREKIIYERQDEIYKIGLERDRLSAERSGTIFTQSTETLNLVNQTLNLAKDASERASRLLAKKLSTKHNELEQEAIDLLEESKSTRNFKVLVEDSHYRSNLLTLALEITGLQHNQNILEEDVLLHPNCSFIRGMEFHLNQHFKPAIKYWKQTKDHPQAKKSLKVMALYWIAYEQNNLKDYENATINFEEASSLAEGSMKYELDRIKIESKFFDVNKYDPLNLVIELELLQKEIKKLPNSDDYKKVASSIAGTLGNIYYEIGNKYAKENNTKSNDFYNKSKEAFFNAPIKNKWTWFGYGEACYKLNLIKEAEQIFIDKVKTEAELDYSTRPEPRTKVLGQTTVLICSVRVKSLHDNVNAQYNLIKATLGSVDDRLSIYSQFQRRNVGKKQYLADLDAFMREFTDNNIT